ncbi:MAG: CCA tRNA nucleotidyltransferase [Thermoguttaceae bacterium]|jgi:tRNA nucleotidyltransferase/poly(A) polymerase
MLLPQEQRQFAVEAVRKLRNAGFEAYWAGGCVRDQLLGRTPKDYDVATNAAPPQIREIFGRRRTLAIGASFGVITVIGPKSAGMIEVATFREDAAYSDGRHPDHVTFSSAREDAQRRDFTINGLFYDPLEDRVIDYVGGQEDLAQRRIRAIGNPRERFAEDKLRLIRAVRFSATFDFALEEETRAAIIEMADQIGVVSPERIAMEMRRMLVDSSRVAAIRLLLATNLAAAVLPEIVPKNHEQSQQLEQALSVLARLRDPAFPLALAALLHTMPDPSGAKEVARRWRLSNKETERAVWLVENQRAIINPQAMKWSALQPILIAEGIHDLLELMEASSPDGDRAAAYCLNLLLQPPEILDPPPLVTGEDLIQLGIPQGPAYRTLLQQMRDMQLDGEILTSEAAKQMLKKAANCHKA